MNKALENYVGLVDFLADFLGEDVEVALHDFTDLENSVAAIRNGHISGRDIGAPATDLVLKILKENNDNKNNKKYITGYKSQSVSGKTLKSATYFIRNKTNYIEGMLCINMNIDKMVQMQSFLEKFIGISETQPAEGFLSETLSQSSEDLRFTVIQKVVDTYALPPDRMDQDEKIEIVEKLNNMGVFLVKGAVFEVSKALAVSEATVYRYLSKIKKKK
ncbi:MAG: transcriptional regulator [Lachnospirales bacterium]